MSAQPMAQDHSNRPPGKEGGTARVDAENYFADLSQGLQKYLQGNEAFTCSYAAEQSDFVRFNHARIRQAGSIDQAYVSLRLISEDGAGQRQASLSLTLSRDLAADLVHCERVFASLRNVLPELPVDPLLTVETEGFTSRNVRVGRLPSGMDMASAITTLGVGHDLVGFLATGPIQRGFASSYGHHNWHEVANFNFEWSLYYEADKAAKSSYTGFEWDAEALRAKIIRAANDVAVLRQPPKLLDPGAYRVFLAPTAMAEIVSMMTWGGFSAKARATRQSPMQRLYEGQASLSPMVSIAEHTSGGLSPTVQSDGFRKPDRVELIKAGRSADLLVSPRTASEYGLAQNGAEVDNEVPQSLDMAGGGVASAEVMRELGTGMCIHNLWYLNFSDRMNCRMTGMTRFATFWVENGEAVAPANVMRFDDSLYRMLGDGLTGLTETREFIADSSTYKSRMTSSMRVPGAFVDGFLLTL
ncbi:MAG: metallopeptidase TldD-related protein [Burkholderiaceae bacterium]